MVKKFLKGNEVFVRDVFARNKNLFEALKKGQTPRAIWFGCSDSRVVPELITCSLPGTIFAKRNLANTIPRNDNAVGAAFEYAIGHLHVPLIIVCGHYDCGGVNALYHKTTGHLKEHLSGAEPALTIVKTALERKKVKVGDEEEKRMVVEANVLLQMENALSYGVVAKAFRKGEVEIHGLVYDVCTGKLHEDFPALSKRGLLNDVEKRCKIHCLRQSK